VRVKILRVCPHYPLVKSLRPFQISGPMERLRLL